jgi:outer membrane protein OmpA-like peptidoglycan-associated protein
MIQIFSTVHKQRIISIALLLLLAFHSFSCNNTARGLAIGAVAGGIAGVLIADGKNNARGILIGAAIGGLAGSIIGSYMDKHAKKLREKVKNAEIERVGESILVTFDSGLMFDVDSYKLRANTKKNLAEMAATINEYKQTELIVMGHTDNTGTNEHNQTLSEQRAVAVANFLKQKGVSSGRFTTKGFGETKPKSDNSSNNGRQANRRVEIAIVANSTLQKEAMKGIDPLKK